jgi:hypothetical protein
MPIIRPAYRLSVKTDDHPTLERLLEKHDAVLTRHENPPHIEYRIQCPALPGQLIITPDELNAAPRGWIDAAQAAYTLVLTKFIDALDAEGVEP